MHETIAGAVLWIGLGVGYALSVWLLAQPGDVARTPSDRRTVAEPPATRRDQTPRRDARAPRSLAGAHR
jgi:hypothetical protein